MKLKRLIVCLMAFAMVMVGMSTITPAAFAEDEAIAYISYADEAWAVQYWFDGNDYAPVKETNVAVTDYGQYTVALDLTETEGGFGQGIAFLDVEIANGEALFPESFMTIDSLKINGEEVELASTYTSSDDGVATRTNLLNEWVAEIVEGRTADGDNSGISAVTFDKSLYPEVKTIEVTFTLGEGVLFEGAPSEEAETKELPEEGTTAYLSMADNSWAVQYWFDGNDYAPIVANNATVTGYGQYTVSLDFTGVEGGVCPDIAFMDVEVDGGEFYFPNCYMQIDSVLINGEAVELGNTYTSSDNAEDTRTNLFNTWVASVEEGRTNGLDLSEVTAAPVDGTMYTDIETVEVTFTLMEGEAMVAEEEEYVMPTEFNAFMMFSDVSGAWAMYEPGTSGDTTVLGDGTYEVYLKAEEIGATGQATEGQVFLVDIEGLGRAMVELGTLREADDESITDTDAQVSVEVYVDGEQVNVKNDNILVGDIEKNDRLRIELYNTWGTGTQDNPVVMPNVLTPESEIKVVFTLVGTGLNTAEAVEEEPVKEEATATPEPVEEATEAPVEEEAEGGLSTGLLIVIIAGAAVVIAGVLFLLLKKKK